jgi:hypothetical protein
MHNSQNGTSMNFDNSPTPNEILLRADCIGCHAVGLNSNIDPVTGAPQVLHSNAIDLAGGNFAYITGFGGKSRITADQNSAGHNVIDLGDAYKETVLPFAPPDTHPDNTTPDVFTCGGRYGCHGNRPLFGLCASSLDCIKGSHHKNVDGKIDTVGDDNFRSYNSYRFLWGVRGFENTGWRNVNANNHNEYFGATSPMSNMVDCLKCKTGVHALAVLRPDNNTISGFCGTCHRDFHFLEGIGGDTTSPFQRHPTDVVLKGTGEYSAYTTYSVEAPIARPIVPGAPSSTVTPGTDVVMCLSCHSSHATPYADILRWDYSDMIAGDTSKSGGCFTCHTQKNQNP